MRAMRRLRPGLLVLLWISLLPMWAVGVARAVTQSPFTLRLSAPISSWDEAIPLGNGLGGDDRPAVSCV